MSPRGRPLLLLAAALAATAPPGAAQEGPPAREGPPRRAVVRVAPDEPLRGGERPVASAADVRGGAALAALLDTLQGPARVELAPGVYRVSATPYRDPFCGNCQDPNVQVEATRGLRMSGERIELVGSHPDSAVIHTGAGYGVLVDGCRACSIRDLTVTGGARDPDARATDGGIVARATNLTIERCIVRDNVGDPRVVRETEVGIAGIVGREGSILSIRECRITGNSWDGIALYRLARAEIRDNVIDGVEAASGERIGGGRGVGIGLTWDSRGVVGGNLVTRYWKGIGVFVDADAAVEGNVVEDVLAWGIALWDAEDKGIPRGLIVGNAVHRTGACGILVHDGGQARGGAGTLSGNAVVRSGQDPRYDGGEPYCPQRAVATTSAPPGFAIADNLLFGNRGPEGAPGAEDLTEAEFRRRVQPLVRELRRSPATGGSRFVTEFGE